MHLTRPRPSPAHPNAGNRSLALTALHLDTEFKAKLDAGLFRLKGTPVINLASESRDEQDAGSDTLDRKTTESNIFYASWEEAILANVTLTDFAMINFGREVGRLRTCKNCGGVNHFAYKDGVLICPTPERSVPENLL